MSLVLHFVLFLSLPVLSSTGEADKLLADIDDMLADLNTQIDFTTTEEFGSDV